MSGFLYIGICYITVMQEKYELSYKKEYYIVAMKTFKEIWDKEPEGVWESYLNIIY